MPIRRAGGRRAAVLRGRPRRLCGAQGAGQRLLRARPAQDADDRELSRRRPESAVQLDVHLSSRLGSPRPGVLDRMRRHLQLPAALRADAPAASAVSSRGACWRRSAKSASPARRWRRSAGPPPTGCSPTGPRRPSGARRSALFGTVFVGGAAFLALPPRCSGSRNSRRSSRRSAPALGGDMRRSLQNFPPTADFARQSVALGGQRAMICRHGLTGKDLDRRVLAVALLVSCAAARWRRRRAQPETLFIPANHSGPRGHDQGAGRRHCCVFRDAPRH